MPISAKTALFLAAALIVSSVAPASARSVTSAMGPNGNTVTASGSAHPVRGGLSGSGSVTTSGGKSVSGSGMATKNQNGTYTGSASVTTGQGKTVDVTGTGTGNKSGAATVSGSNGSKTIDY